VPIVHLLLGAIGLLFGGLGLEALIQFRFGVVEEIKGSKHTYRQEISSQLLVGWMRGTSQILKPAKGAKEYE